jgi:hypothetical protein
MNSDQTTNRPNEYMGVRFTVEAELAAPADTYIGRYTLLPDDCADGYTGGGADASASRSGVDDVAHPSMDRSWSTQNEAISYATQAAHSAIELLIYGHTQGQGNRGVAAAGRLADD